MSFKFEKLEIWKQSLSYADDAYEIAELLPSKERYNLSDQLQRAATSIALNIAEGSTGQSDKEQRRFLGMALRSLIETVACIHLIKQRNYFNQKEEQKKLNNLYNEANQLAARIQSMRNVLSKKLNEPTINYLATKD